MINSFETINLFLKIIGTNFFFALFLTLGARLPVLGPFHMGVVPSVPTLDMMPCYEL